MRKPSTEAAQQSRIFWKVSENMIRMTVIDKDSSNSLRHDNFTNEIKHGKYVWNASGYYFSIEENNWFNAEEKTCRGVEIQFNNFECWVPNVFERFWVLSTFLPIDVGLHNKVKTKAIINTSGSDNGLFGKLYNALVKNN